MKNNLIYGILAGVAIASVIALTKKKDISNIKLDSIKDKANSFIDFIEEKLEKYNTKIDDISNDISNQENIPKKFSREKFN